MPEQAVSDPPAEEPDAVQFQEAVVQEAPWAPVPESEAVEDTYFQDVIFLGDSRTEGFSLYSGLKEGTYFYSVGCDGGVGFFPKCVDHGRWKQSSLAGRHGGGTVRKDLCDAGRQ